MLTVALHLEARLPGTKAALRDGTMVGRRASHNDTGAAAGRVG
ncbi:MAG: hypothetical protein ACRDOH_35870 [Streptosporangiaceae bacterium]